MKKAWTTAEFRRRQRIIASHRDHRHEGSIADRRPRRSTPPRAARGPVFALKAPKVLCAFDEPVETIGFCNELRDRLARPQAVVRLDLSGVTQVSFEALLLVRALMHRRRGLYRSVGGNLPDAPLEAAKLKASGFFNGFARPPGGLPRAAGLMRFKTERKVHSEVAAELLDFAGTHAEMSKTVADASFNNLVELMSNTYHHAAGAKRPKGTATWMAGVYCEGGVAEFAFIDMGVGILASTAPRDFLRRIGHTLQSFGGPASLLVDTFMGKIGASADQEGRGFGLTTMRVRATDGLLPDLRVLTSSVSGRVASLEFGQSDMRFVGTIYRWKSKQVDHAD